MTQQTETAPEDLTHSPGYVPTGPEAQAWLDLVGREQLLREAQRIHGANGRQLGDWHYEWLLGQASLTLACRNGHPAPEWWSDWSVTPFNPLDIDRSPLFALARLLGDERILATGPDRVALTCRRCGQTGYSGGYPFSTLGGADICDDCV